MAFTAQDQTQHTVSGGTGVIDVAASAGANQTINSACTTLAGTSIGTPTYFCGFTVLGNAANATTNCNITLYDGAPSTANRVLSIIGDAWPLNTKKEIGRPIVRGLITVAAQANCAATWIDYLSAGPGGQPGNVTGV